MVDDAKLAGVLERERFDVDDLCGEAGGIHGRLALLDVVGTGRDQQDVEKLGILFIGTDDLVVEADLFHGEGDVLVGLNLDLPFEIALGEAGGHLNDLGDRGVAGNRDGDVGRFRACALHCTANRLADRLGIDNCLLADRTRRCGFSRIRLDAVAFSALRHLDQLD